MNTIMTASADFLVDCFVPICICVVLPCLIVWLVMSARKHDLDKKAEVAMKAIEKGVQIDPNTFSQATRDEKEKSIKEKIFHRLTTGSVLSGLGLAIIISAVFGKDNAGSTFYLPSVWGGILLMLGLAFIVTYFIGRKQFAAEIAAEEEKIGKE